MPDPTPTPAAASKAPAAQKHGYFNQAQLEDLDTAADVLAAAQEHAADLAARAIDAAYLTGFETAIGQARTLTNATGQAISQLGNATEK